MSAYPWFPVAASKWRALLSAFRKTKKDAQGRFAGTPDEQQALVEKIGQTLSGEIGKARPVMVDYGAVNGVAGTLRVASNNWLVGNYVDALEAAERKEPQPKDDASDG